MSIVNKEVSYEMVDMKTKYKVEELIGTQIAHLTVLGFDHDVLMTNERGITRIKRYVKCKCDCGKETVVVLNDLMNGNVQSCGHIRQYSHLIHGLHHTRAYKTWRGMMDRCYNKNSSSYANYGGRKPPIIVCELWRKNFQAFYTWSLKNGYYEQPKGTPRSEILSIERKNPNGNYTPENCEWIPFKEQSRNRRNVIKITDYDGEKLVLAEFARKHDVPKETLLYRYRNGWSIDEIVYSAYHPELVSNTGPDRETYRLLTKDGFKVLIPTIDFMLRKNRIEKRGE